MNGTIKLEGFGGRSYFTVAGGPIREKPKHYVGVKLAVEIKQAEDIVINIKDFSLPKVWDLDRTLPAIVDAIRICSPVYVGCLAGRGRTGLVLAILAKAWGVKEPIKWVRKHYMTGAVETPEQERFVQSYSVLPDLKRQIFWLKVRMIFLSGNLTVNI